MIHCFISEQQEEGEDIRVAASTRRRARLPKVEASSRGGGSQALWQRRLNDQPARQVRPLSAPLFHTLRHLPLGFRLWRQARSERGRGKEPVVDSSRQGDGSCAAGVPAGGMGAGMIGRSWTGDFEPGLIFPNPRTTPTVVPANQFSIFVEPDGELSEARVLNPGMPPAGRLESWDWSFVGEDSYYSALFPRAWTVYEEPEPRLRATCRQISPVIGHNYRESSFPICVFVWTLENLDEEDSITTSLMFTWQNGTGDASDSMGGHCNTPFTRPHPQRDGAIRGVLMEHKQWFTDEHGQRKHSDDPLAFAIAASSSDPEANITVRSCWTTSSDGSEVWRTFKKDGTLEESSEDFGKPSQEGKQIGSAIAVRVTVPPGECKEVEFVLAWDHPIVQFGSERRYPRRYTRFYSTHGDSAMQMAVDGLTGYSHWEDQIEQWQAPVLEDLNLPGWYKSALFNELSLLVSNSAVWLQDDSDKDQKAYIGTRKEEEGPEGEDRSEEIDDLGKWACLESKECRVYNSTDALFYASFALIANWPLLQLALQKEVARAVLREDSRLVDILSTGRQAPLKVKGAVPHDFGAPMDDPWVSLNAYNIHDTSERKDLGSKFTLSVYRDYVATRDKKFLASVWPAVDAALQYMIQHFVRNEHGMVENRGTPDQTYHSWTATGISAYTGGLWIAALSAAVTMCKELGLPASVTKRYQDLYHSAAPFYEKALWNSSGYFNYESHNSANRDSIQADQLCGQWYARACGLPSIASDKRVRKALKTIFANNVKKFNEGKRGAVNGMRPDGRVDFSSLHSSEAWPGTSFALAACMMGEGRVDDAFATASGVCFSIYRDLSYWFRTPEAWDTNGNFRALSHIRSLAIWGMQWAWVQRKQHSVAEP